MGKVTQGEISDSNTTPRKTMPGEALEAQKDHKNKWPYRGLDNLKTGDTEKGKSERPTKILHTAVTNRGQLHALEGDVATHEVLVPLDEPPTVKASPKGKLNQKKEQAALLPKLL